VHDVRDGAAKVVLLDANHCPGAAMFAFWRPGEDGIAVHTGDFRFDETLWTRHRQTLRTCFGDEVATVVTKAVIDTTFCAREYAFPSQDAVEASIAEAVRRASPAALVLIGTYSIGKERVLMRVARALGKQVYVEEKKLTVLR
jgi:DNA cross-link repair 1A protein